MAEKPIDLVIDDTHIAGGAAVVDQDPDVAVGISLPLTHSPRGYFHQEYLTVKQVKHNIRNLLLTMKGERVMQPQLGTDIYSILFEQDDGTLGIRVKESIQEAFKIWLPFVRIENLNVVSADDSSPGTPNDGVETHRNVFHIEITFSLQNDPTMLEHISLRLTGPEI
tara:strand:+ start:65 stop:565 length:501 start_codon:yes stop_codon:yes gene_type:complete